MQARGREKSSAAVALSSGLPLDIQQEDCDEVASFLHLTHKTLEELAVVLSLAQTRLCTPTSVVNHDFTMDSKQQHRPADDSPSS